jgi:hypothetical protein
MLDRMLTARTLLLFTIRVAAVALVMPLAAQQTVCGQSEYAAMLKKSPPSGDYLHYPIPSEAQIDIQQTLREGWPRRSFSLSVVYRFPSGTKVSDVERFFVQAGVDRLFGTVYRDVNPNRKPGDVMRKVTEEDGHVTFSIARQLKVSEGTPFGDVAWVARQLRDHPPTAADLLVPLYPRAVLDIDSSTTMIVSEPSPRVSYFTSDSPGTVKAFYGIPAVEIERRISRFDSVSVEAYRGRDPQKRTKITVQVSYEYNPGRQERKIPVAHLTGAGPAVAGPPPDWKPRQWKGGCERGPIAPIVASPR